MRLGYFRYGQGLARVIFYGSEIEWIIASFVSPDNEQEQKVPFRAFTPSILVGPVMLEQSFSLEAWREGMPCGTCQATFNEGLCLTEKTGIFTLPSTHPLTDKRTLHATAYNDCPGLSQTEVVLLSRPWLGYGLIVGQKGIESWDLEEWDSTGIKERIWQGRRRITGQSIRYGDPKAECGAALVAVTSGPQSGKAGWLLWGDDAGVAISGVLGDTAGALWLPNLESFPERLHSPNSEKYIGLPPACIPRST